MCKILQIYLLHIFWLSSMLGTGASDMTVTLDKSCYNIGDPFTVTAVYDGTGETLIRWDYSEISSTDYLQYVANTCTNLSGHDTGFPSSITASCTIATHTYSITVSGDITSEDAGRQWGATVSLSSGTDPSFQYATISICSGGGAGGALSTGAIVGIVIAAVVVILHQRHHCSLL